MIYLSYKGFIITQDSNGYINATEMCRINNKRVDDWVKTQKTQNYISYISKDLSIPASQLVISIKGNFSNTEQGTWIHPELAICLGRWISVEFAVWCDRHIKKYLESSSKPKDPLNMGWYFRNIEYKKKTKIPYDYFSIFAELTCGLISDFETAGYGLPSDSYIDISVGRHWSEFIQSRRKDIESLRTMYSHHYPDGRIVDAFIYHNSLLPEFRDWMERNYKTGPMISYLKKKDSRALTALSELLGIPLQMGLFDQLTAG